MYKTYLFNYIDCVIFGCLNNEYQKQEHLSSIYTSRSLTPLSIDLWRTYVRPIVKSIFTTSNLIDNITGGSIIPKRQCAVLV